MFYWQNVIAKKTLKLRVSGLDYFSGGRFVSHGTNVEEYNGNPVRTTDKRFLFSSVRRELGHSH